MAVNKRKVLDAARKYAQKGAKQKALKEYNTLLKLDPRDAKLRLEVGDAHRRWNENEEAIGHYHKVADQYQQDGFDARAVAVHKQILNLDPKRYAAYVALSDLYQRMGLDAEAVGALQTAADGYHKEGQKREALELLRKMAQLDPSNTTSRLKVAELLKQEGLEDDAVEEFEAVAEELTRQGEAGAAENVYQRLVELRPDRTEILLLMARNAIAMRRPERAESWAKRAVENDENEETLEVLCDVFKALERTDELIEATKRLATIYRERGDEDTARTIMQRLPGVDAIGDTSETSDAIDIPDGPDETEESLIGDGDDLGDDDFLADDGTDVFELGGDLDDEIGADAFGDPADLELDTGDELELDAPLSAPEPAEAESSSALGTAPEGDPDQLLAEASVYLRYGKTDQAVASLRAILADEPGHRAALEKLGEALVESDDPAGAVAVWSNAAERAREEDDFDGFDVLCGRIATLDEDAAAALGPAQPVAEEPAAPEAAADEIDVDADDALFSDEAVADVAGDVGGDEVPDEMEIDFDLDDVEGESADASSATVNGSSTTTAQQVKGELAEAEFYFEQQMFEEAQDAYERVLEVAPNHPSALLRIGEIAAAQGGDPAEVVEGTAEAGATNGVDSPAEDETLGGAVAPIEAEADSDDELSISIDLDEIEEFDDEVELDMSADAVELPVDVSDIAEADDALAANPVSEIDFDVDVDLDVDDDELTLGADGEVDASPEPVLAADELAAALAQARSAPASEAEACEAEITQAIPSEDELPLDVASQKLEDEPAPTESEDDGGDAADGSVDEPIEAPEPLAAAADEHEDESFDLAAELSGAFDDEEDDENASSADGSLQGTEEEAFASLFNDFKRGVTETLDEGDYETRYDLAIAYREMGLVDDAIAAFQICVPCPRRGLDSLQLMAQCQLDAGRVADAIGHLEQALSTEGLSPERRAGVYFDLGRAFAASGDTARARTNFETVAELDPSFPGVADAVADLLEQMENADTAEPDEAADDDVFESFDDVVAEATAEAVVGSVASEVAADESFESFADVIEEAEEVIDAAGQLLSADAEPEMAEVEPEAVVEAVVEATAEPASEAAPEASEVEPEASEVEPEDPKPKKARKKISFV